MKDDQHRKELMDKLRKEMEPVKLEIDESYRDIGRKNDISKKLRE